MHRHVSEFAMTCPGAVVARLGITLCTLFFAVSASAQVLWESDAEERRRIAETCRAAGRAVDGQIDRERVVACLATQEREREEAQQTDETARRRAAIAKDLEATKSVTAASSKAEREQRDRAQCRAQNLNHDATVNEDAYVACRARLSRMNGAHELAATRQRCGADYQRVALGMAWVRVLDCAGPFNRVSQINRQQRIVTTYQSALFRVSVIDGKVASWEHTGRQGFVEAR